MNDEREFSREEMEVLHKAVTMYLTISNIEVARHKMYKEESMDRLFEKMENYATAGVVWVKISKALGVPEEAIIEYLESVDK